MLAARTIGGLIAVAAAVLALLGLHAARRADAARFGSLLRSARFIGMFFYVWLARDVAELVLARSAALSFARSVDLVCVSCSLLLATALLFGRGVHARPSMRVAVGVLAVLTGASGVLRIFA